MVKNDVLTELENQTLIYLIQEALDEFTSTINSKNSPNITGLYIVGSVLQDDFELNQSDIDIYIEIDSEFEYEEGFRRLLADSGEPHSQQLQPLVPEKATNIDIIGLVQDDTVIREPNRFIPKQ